MENSRLLDNKSHSNSLPTQRTYSTSPRSSPPQTSVQTTKASPNVEGQRKSLPVAPREFEDRTENLGRWSNEEHQVFLRGIERHGKQWRTIATMIGTRTAVQVRTHAQKYLRQRDRTEKPPFHLESTQGVRSPVSKQKSLPTSSLAPVGDAMYRYKKRKRDTRDTDSGDAGTDRNEKPPIDLESTQGGHSPVSKQKSLPASSLAPVGDAMYKKRKRDTTDTDSGDAGTDKADDDAFSSEKRCEKDPVKPPIDLESTQGGHSPVCKQKSLPTSSLAPVGDAMYKKRKRDTTDTDFGDAGTDKADDDAFSSEKRCEKDLDAEDSELVDLPEELRCLGSMTFKCQDELEKELVMRGFPDLPVVLDASGKARLRMTSGAHDVVTHNYTYEFNTFWGKNRWGIAVDGSTNIFIQPLPGRNLTRRKPDIAFWGYKKCKRNKRGALELLKLANPPNLFQSTGAQVERVNPDVVLQFSWGNSAGEEVAAINDMMNRVHCIPHQPYNDPPKVGYLLKMRTAGGKRTHSDRKDLQQLDLYRIPRGATFEDATNNRNGACHLSYVPGETDDVIIEITAHDLGIEGLWALVCQQPFRISAKDIFESLR